MVAAVAEFLVQLSVDAAIYFRVMRWLIVGVTLAALWAFGGLATGAGWVVAAVCVLYLAITEAAVATKRRP